MKQFSIFSMFKGVSGTPEMGRILWFLGAVATIAYQGYAVFKGQGFDPLQFAGGFATLLAAGGFGIAQKDTGVARALESASPYANIQLTEDINVENTNVGKTKS